MDMDGNESAGQSPENQPRKYEFFWQAMVFYGVGAFFVAFFLLLWLAFDVVLLVFASILVAILLHDASCKLQKWLPLSHGPALGLVIVLVVAILALGGWLLAPTVSEQANQLIDAIPRSVQRLRDSLRSYGVLEQILGSLPAPEKMVSQASSMLARAGVFFSGVFGALANVVIITVLGIYLAARPSSYTRGIVTLVPKGKRRRARQVLEELGHTLAEWLMGKMLSMLIVGIVTVIGLVLLDVPLAIVLGILAGLLDFIPYIGPILAGVPAVLIAFAESPMQALYVTLLFVALQSAEGYLLSPLIERRTVSLPPALTITMQVLLGTFFGLAGVALATPLTAVAAVLITMLYVQDVLGDPVPIPGED